MKSFIIVLMFVVAGVLAASQLDEEKEKLEHIHEKCQADPATHADEELLKHLSENLDNPQVGAHMLCESKGIGLQDKNGKLDKKVINSKVCMEIKDKKKADSIVNECAIQKKTPEDTAVHLFMCLDKHGLTYFHEF